MKNASKQKDFLISTAIFLTAACLFSIGAQYKTYSSPDEKRYIKSAEEMAETGDWITPRYYGRPRFQKPILFYWMAALSMLLFKNPWLGARIPSVIFGALTVLMTYLLGRILYDRRTGLISAVVLSLSGAFYIFSKLATPDMLTLFFITLSFFLFARAYFSNERYSLRYTFFGALALAFLTKGIAGAAIPIFTVIAFYSFGREKKIFTGADILIGAVIFFLLAGPWFAVMFKIHGASYLNHIWRVETLNRINESSGFGYLFRYIAATLILFLPSAILLPAAVTAIVRRKNFSRETRLLSFWYFAVIVFFTLFGTKKFHYILMAAPPAALVTGNFCSNLIGSRRGAGRIFVFSAVFLLLLYSSLFGYLLPLFCNDNGLLALSDRILSSYKEGERVGVGSHFISHDRLGAYLGFKARKINVDLYDPQEQLIASRSKLRNFFNLKERVYCLITREDFQEYVTGDILDKIYVIDKGYYWKKPNQLNLPKGSLISILKGDKSAFRQVFKNEIYLLSNRPD